MNNFKELDRIIGVIEHASRDQLKEMALIRQEIAKLRPTYPDNERREHSGVQVTRSLTGRGNTADKETNTSKKDVSKETNGTQSEKKSPSERNYFSSVINKHEKYYKKHSEGNENKNTVSLKRWRQSKGDRKSVV